MNKGKEKADQPKPNVPIEEQPASCKFCDLGTTNVPSDCTCREHCNSPRQICPAPVGES
jgi:hypothetical protein